MNIPPHVKQKLETAKTVDNLKEVITDILDEYDFGILSELRQRINDLEERMC